MFIDMFITHNYATTLGQMIDQILNIVDTFYMLHDANKIWIDMLPKL